MHVVIIESAKGLAAIQAEAQPCLSGHFVCAARAHFRHRLGLRFWFSLVDFVGWANTVIGFGVDRLDKGGTDYICLWAAFVGFLFVAICGDGDLCLSASTCALIFIFYAISGDLFARCTRLQMG